MKEPFQILSLDGGGIKGIFSAAVLANLEEDYGIKITDHFDLITGTSTGGIIALALGIGMRPRQIVDFYVREAPNIFASKPFAKVMQYLRCKYSSEGLRHSLEKCFKDKQLKDSNKRLVIPAYNLGKDDVYLFKTAHHTRFQRDWKVKMRQVALATSAAPTFFPSLSSIDNIRLIDGGIWANNPIMVGITEAKGILGKSLKSIKVFSIGTTYDLVKRSKKLDSGGFWHWKKDAVTALINGQTVGSLNQAVHLLGPEKVLRLDPMVPEGVFNLDKIADKDLIAEAADESRKIAPKFYDSFCDHKAPPFKHLINKGDKSGRNKTTVQSTS